MKLFAAAPLAGAAYAAVDADTSLNFHFSGDSYRVNTAQQSPPGGYQPGTYGDRLVFGGSGVIRGRFKVGQLTTGGIVNAQGSFAHYDVGVPAGSGPPPGTNIPLKFTGTWKATGLVSFQFIGLYGTDGFGVSPLAAGVLVLDIILVRPATPSIPLTQVPSRLWLVSTLGTGTGPLLSEPAGFQPIPGSPDGVTLLAPNDPMNGFFFVPIPVVSTAPDAGEARTTVLFSTLDENRNQPTHGSGG